VTVTVSSELNVLVVGVLLVVFVVVAPDGVIGLIKKWKTSLK
jgi:branched-chain amino acid transport system permease protein